MSKINVPTLETGRLVLRGWQRRDAAALYAYACNPNVGPNAGWKPHGNVRESRTIITQMFQQNTTWAITLKEDLVIQRTETRTPARPEEEIGQGEEMRPDEENGKACETEQSGETVLIPAGVPVGSIGFEPDAYRPRIASREMGYSLNEDCWGHGIMTEAARRLLKYGFEEMMLQSVMIRTGEGNLRSRRVIDKCGFHYEGTLRRCYLMHNGRIRDSRVYSLLREEYEELAAVWGE